MSPSSKASAKIAGKPSARERGQIALPFEIPARSAPLAEPIVHGPERDHEIAAALGAWFDAVARDLPWRRTRDPYAIWLSEIMLQQTRVDTVIPYFDRFLSRFPTVGDLARADLDQVLSLWSGLGYYRRARIMHLAAREVTERHGGVFPGDAQALRALPGVGAYTAGAVASIAFDLREPLVDGNVARVLSRLDAIDDDIRSTTGQRALWAAAARLVPEARPGRFNQALMELGATVCTPRAPRCTACPVNGLCVARAEGREEDLPVLAPKRKVPSVRMVAAVLWTGHRVYLARRTEGGLFGGLWEPPMVEADTLDEARTSLAEAGIPERIVLCEVGRVRHILTHRRLEVTVARAEVPAALRGRAKLASPYEKASWLDPDANEVGVSRLARKILSVSSPPVARAEVTRR